MAGKSVTGLAGFVRGIEGGDVWIGVDVHKNKYFVAIVSDTGACHDWSCPADPEGFVRQIKKLALNIKTVAYEAGPTGFVLARALQAAGLPALVAAPSRIMRPVTAGAKSDRLDCRKLAGLAMRGVLKPIAAPTEAEEGRRSLRRRHHRLADGLRRVKAAYQVAFAGVWLGRAHGIAAQEPGVAGRAQGTAHAPGGGFDPGQPDSRVGVS